MLLPTSVELLCMQVRQTEPFSREVLQTELLSKNSHNKISLIQKKHFNYTGMSLPSPHTWITFTSLTPSSFTKISSSMTHFHTILTLLSELLIRKKKCCLYKCVCIFWFFKGLHLTFKTNSTPATVQSLKISRCCLWEHHHVSYYKHVLG